MVILALLTAWAGRYATDQNHPGLAWHTVSTAHFDIHYPRSRNREPDDERYVDGGAMAQQLAARADDIWLRVCRAVDHYPSERIDVVVLEDTDELVGFTLTQQGWIVLSGNPGPELARMRGRSMWAPDLLAHELAHVITLKKAGWFEEKTGSYGLEVGGLADVDQHHLGGSIQILQDEPFWWSEGAAEYASEEAGVNWWTTSRAMTMRAMALEGRLLSRVEWRENKLLSGWFEAERAYQQGYAFHRWFARIYGHDAWLQVMTRSSRRFQVDWSSVYEKVSGEPIDRLKEAFEQDLRAEAEAFVAAREAEGIVEGIELATWDQGWQATNLRDEDRWSAVDDDERDRRREGTGTMTLHARYSADGRWFGRQRSGWLEVRKQDEDFWTVFAGGVPDWDLTDAQRDESSSVSAWLPSRYLSDFDFVPGQDALVMVGLEDAHRTEAEPQNLDWTRLYRVDLTPVEGRYGPELPASMRRRLEPIPGTLRASDPSVSPDGAWLAYVVYRHGSQDLVVSRIDGSERRLLTDHRDGSWVQGTDWSPDGTRIVAAVHRNHQQNLWTFDVATGAGEPVMTDAWEELDPHWANDGSIWFAADVDGAFDIFRRGTDGRIHRMTRVRTGANAPSLTPDGDLLYHQFTAWGWKTHGRQVSELAWEDATDRFDPPLSPVAVALPEPLPTHRYRALHSFTGLAMSPSFRLDRSVDGTILPRLGAFLKLRDAVEVHTLTLQGWIGRDASVTGRWTWHRFWPDLTIHGSHWAGRLPGATERRQLTLGGARLHLPWRDDLWAELAWYGFVVQEQGPEGYRAKHRSSVLEAVVGIGEGDRLQIDDQATGGSAELVLNRGTSQGARQLSYHRVEARGRWVIDAPAEHHRWDFEGAAALTDRPVELDDALRLGGDHSYGLRPGWAQSSLAFPGYAPFAIRAQHLGKLGASWRIPIAIDLREAIGPLIVDTIMLGVGGDAGIAIEGRESTVLADARAELRVGSTLLGSRFNSVLRVAYGAPIPGGAGGPRVIMAVGSGF